MQVGTVGTYTVTERDTLDPSMGDKDDVLPFLPLNVDGDGYVTGLVFRTDGTTVVRGIEPEKTATTATDTTVPADTVPATSAETTPTVDTGTVTLSQAEYDALVASESPSPEVAAGDNPVGTGTESTTTPGDTTTTDVTTGGNPA